MSNFLGSLQKHSVDRFAFPLVMTAVPGKRHLFAAKAAADASILPPAVAATPPKGRLFDSFNISSCGSVYGISRAWDLRSAKRRLWTVCFEKRYKNGSFKHSAFCAALQFTCTRTDSHRTGHLSYPPTPGTYGFAGLSVNQVSTSEKVSFTSTGG